MRYIAPSTLLGKSLPRYPDTKAIQLERKKLFAELELSGGESIGLSKNDIIAYFEELQQEGVPGYHQDIEDDPTLRSFLETATLERGARFGAHASPDFIRWVSPYFLSAFKTFADAGFRQEDLGGWETLLGNRWLMTEGDAGEAWLFVVKVVNNDIAYMEHYRARDGKSAEEAQLLENVSPLIDFAHTRLILALPADRLGNLRDEYAFKMMQVCILIFNRYRTKRVFPLTCMVYAGEVASSADMRHTAANKLVEMEGIERKRRRRRNWRIARIALAAFFILSRIIAGVMDSESPRSDVPVTDTAKSVVDSAVRVIKGLDSARQR
jgi:hypothetical protein